MPTGKPIPPLTPHELTDRRIAEFALEVSHLSSLAYRFKLEPRERVWSNWDRTEFEPNHYRLLGLAGVCLNRDEQASAHRAAVRALEDVDDIFFYVEQPAPAVIVRNSSGTSEIVNRPTLCAEICAGSTASFDNALGALEAAFSGGRVVGRILSEE